MQNKSSNVCLEFWKNNSIEKLKDSNRFMMRKGSWSLLGCCNLSKQEVCLDRKCSNSKNNSYFSDNTRESETAHIHCQVQKCLNAFLAFLPACSFLSLLLNSSDHTGKWWQPHLTVGLPNVRMALLNSIHCVDSPYKIKVIPHWDRLTK